MGCTACLPSLVRLSPDSTLPTLHLLLCGRKSAEEHLAGRADRLPLEYFAGIRALEDYPAEQGGDAGAGQLAPELRTLLAGAQRLDPDRRRILIRRVEALLETLGEAGLSERASARPG